MLNGEKPSPTTDQYDTPKIVHRSTPTPEEFAFLALGRDATKRGAKEAVRRGVTVWNSVGEYLENLSDNGIEADGTPEEIKAGKYAGAVLVPVTVNGKKYLVEFVL